MQLFCGHWNLRSAINLKHDPLQFESWFEIESSQKIKCLRILNSAQRAESNSILGDSRITELSAQAIFLKMKFISASGEEGGVC